MSLDLFLTHPPCPTCKHEPERIEFNYTYNVSPMWYAIYPDAKNMVDIDDLTGENAMPIIAHAIVYMVQHKRELEDLNPKNGWGSYAGFLEFLFKINTACEEHPDLVWSSWR